MRPYASAMAVLSRRQLSALDEARTAVLATISPDDRARTVPVCFVIGVAPDDTPAIYSPIDDKPKATADPLDLARVRDVAARPTASLLVHHWDEDWTQLGWLRIEGTARVTEARPEVIAALRAKYAQYADHRLESRPMIEITIERVVSWGTLAGD